MRFEDLEVWQRSAKLSGEIYKALAGLKDYGFRDQICRSGLSIPSNIAEGMERGSPKQFVQFLRFAKGSCGELRTQLYIGMHIGYLEHHQAQPWVQETREISAMLVGLMKAIKKRVQRAEFRGQETDPEDREQSSEFRGQETDPEDREQSSEFNGQETDPEDRGQSSEFNGQETNTRSQGTEGKKI